MLNLHELPVVDLDPELTLLPGPLGQQIDHPLVKEVFYTPHFNHIYNEQLRVKKEKVAQSLSEAKYYQYIFWHERPYRLNAFLEVHHRMTDQEYWKTLREVWTDSENIWQNQSIWEKMLLSSRQGKDNFMTPEEKKHLDSLPKVITIHRGYNKSPKGFSYSLSRTKATWFAHRYSQQGKVKSLKVNKTEVFAFVDARNEKEVIYLGGKS